jgi:hypothetical protein
LSGRQVCLRGGDALVLRIGQFDLNTVDAVDAVNEQDQDEDEGDLYDVGFCPS